MQRSILQKTRGMETSDGAGVKLTRLLGHGDLPMLDPFLMLDAFGSDHADDYIAGFPAHPHRGFETITYMLDGRMRHEDSAGHAGVIEAGGVQWMTAGRGIIHSEMPEQTAGRLAGFQLWMNLPAARKMVPPAYQELSAEEIPQQRYADGSVMCVVAGRTKEGTQGPILNPALTPIFWVIHARAGLQWIEQLPKHHQAFVYVHAGALEGVGADNSKLVAGDLAVLSLGESFRWQAQTDSVVLVVAGRPLHEPVARKGPFVMNHPAELEQAFADYRAGRLTQAS